MKKTTKIEVPVERGDELFTIDLRDIVPNDFNRKHFDSAKLAELADSMRESGQWTPVLVRRISERVLAKGDAQFELVFGERRWRAAQMANMKSLLAIVKPMTRQEAVEACLIENLQREDLQPMEQAEAFERAIAEGVAKSQRDLAKRVGVSEATVRDYMRLLQLPEKGKEMVRSGMMSHTSAGELLSLETPGAMEDVLAYVEKHHPTTRELSAFARVRRLDEERELKWDADGEYAAKKAKEKFPGLQVSVLRFADRGAMGERPLPVDEQLPLDVVVPTMRQKEFVPVVGKMAARLGVCAVVGSLRPHVADAPPVVLVDLELLRVAESLLPKDNPVQRYLMADDASAKKEQAMAHKRADVAKAARVDAMRDELVSAVKRILDPGHSSDIFGQVLREWMELEHDVSRMEVLEFLAEALGLSRDDDAHEEDEDWIHFVREEATVGATAGQVLEALYFIDALELLIGMESPSMAAIEAGRAWWDASGLDVAEFGAWKEFLR
jgi:ParB family transcriptional regulator, chromosome partitioning protein